MNVTDVLQLLVTPVGSTGVCPWDAAFREENCREAFLNCGIYPLNPALVISRFLERRPIELRPLGGGPQPSASVLAEVTNLLAPKTLPRPVHIVDKSATLLTAEGTRLALRQQEEERKRKRDELEARKEARLEVRSAKVIELERKEAEKVEIAKSEAFVGDNLFPTFFTEDGMHLLSQPRVPLSPRKEANRKALVERFLENAREKKRRSA
jgi:hypothetical protein